MSTGLQRVGHNWVTFTSLHLKYLSSPLTWFLQIMRSGLEFSLCLSAPFPLSLWLCCVSATMHTCASPVVACSPERYGSQVVALGLSCPMAFGILVPLPGIESMSPALQGGFITTGSPGKSLLPFLYLCLFVLPRSMPHLSWHLRLSLKKFFFTYLVLMVPSLPCCMGTFSSCSEQGYPLVVVHGLPTVGTSLVAEQGLYGVWPSVAWT